MPSCGTNGVELQLANSTIERLSGNAQAPPPKLLSTVLGVPLQLRELRDLIDDSEEPEVTRASTTNVLAQDLSLEAPELSLIHI